MQRAGTVTDDYEVAAALRVAIGLLVRKLRQAHLPGELTIAETSALSRLDRGGPATSSEMAKQDRISPQSMGATLAALEQRGLIERRRDPGEASRRPGRNYGPWRTRGRSLTCTCSSAATSRPS